MIAVASDMVRHANWSSIVDIGGRHAGVATGLINTIGNLGHFIQPVIGQAIFHMFGGEVALFVVYVLGLLRRRELVVVLIDPTRPSPCGRTCASSRLFPPRGSA